MILREWGVGVGGKEDTDTRIVAVMPKSKSSFVPHHFTIGYLNICDQTKKISLSFWQRVDSWLLAVDKNSLLLFVYV